MKNLSKATEKKLVALAETYFLELEGRGDLEPRNNDGDDFFKGSVTSLKMLLAAAYELGKNSNK